MEVDCAVSAQLVLMRKMSIFEFFNVDRHS